MRLVTKKDLCLALLIHAVVTLGGVAALMQL